MIIKKVKISVLNGGDAENYERVLNFINSVEKNFPASLSERIDIGIFTKKILNRAIILQALIDDEIIGLSSFYANDLENMKSYLTFIAVKSEYMNMGIAYRLIDEMLLILRKRGIVTVEAITDSGNIAARGLYEKMGFRLIGIRGSRVKYVYFFK